MTAKKEMIISLIDNDTLLSMEDTEIHRINGFLLRKGFVYLLQYIENGEVEGIIIRNSIRFEDNVLIYNVEEIDCNESLYYLNKHCHIRDVNIQCVLDSFFREIWIKINMYRAEYTVPDPNYVYDQYFRNNEDDDARHSAFRLITIMKSAPCINMVKLGTWQYIFPLSVVE